MEATLEHFRPNPTKSSPSENNTIFYSPNGEDDIVVWVEINKYRVCDSDIEYVSFVPSNVVYKTALAVYTNVSDGKPLDILSVSIFSL